ncbi:protein-disulfide reductase DsbD domain-containing protein [Pararhodonellum marinum]|uniref:protein-disulfide reductase DsbD domain-containing protein n=1 Tax=Pararhodonellum marinum TaxID=2755358 RepID=UPI00188F22D2|nr:protein-disulfide reductase DsbD domain-containing protein [Pararhodonellum marinum]
MRLILTKQFQCKSIFCFLVFMFVASSSNAQILEPVKWTIESKKLNEQEFEIVYTAKIDYGWHLYSQFVKPKGPKPTSFDLEKSTKFIQIGKVTEERGYDVYDELFKIDVKYFKGNPVFVQKLKKLNKDKVTIIGEIEFMSCNDISCVPGSFDIEIELL